MEVGIKLRDKINFLRKGASYRKTRRGFLKVKLNLTNLRSEAQFICRLIKLKVSMEKNISSELFLHKTRSDTRLSQSRAGRQGPYLRSLDYLGRYSAAKDRKKKTKKVKCDGPMHQQTDQLSEVYSRVARD